MLKAEDRIRLLGGSALALPGSEPFDLVFADPPYGETSGSDAVAAVVRANWLALGGWMFVETARRSPVSTDQLTIEAERDVGPARITLLHP